MLQQATPDRTDELQTLLGERILLLDGATGTQIQALGITDAEVRGERFADHHKDLKNFADMFCLTKPEVVAEIHRRYLAAGSDIVETNTFGASPIGMADFEFGGPADLAREINAAAVRLAKEVCDEFTDKNPGQAPVRRRFDRPHHQADGHLAPASTTPRWRDVTLHEMVDSLLRAGRRDGRGGGRYPAARDGDRHAQPQGVPVRHRELLPRHRATACR